MRCSDCVLEENLNCYHPIEEEEMNCLNPCTCIKSTQGLPETKRADCPVHGLNPVHATPAAEEPIILTPQYKSIKTVPAKGSISERYKPQYDPQPEPTAESADAVKKALRDCVLYAAPDGAQKDGDFVGYYVIPTGPIHRAIALLGIEPTGDVANISRYQALLATAKAEGRQAVWNTVLEVYSEKSDPWPTLEKLAAEELNHE